MNHPERVIQQHMVQTLSSLGGFVWELGTTRSRRDFHMGTRQTPGLPDLMAFLPPAPLRPGSADRRKRLLIIEAKASGGRLRPEQFVFRECCLEAGIDHLVGGLDELLAWLAAEGYIKADNIPHHRQSGQPPRKVS